MAASAFDEPRMKSRELAVCAIMAALLMAGAAAGIEISFPEVITYGDNSHRFESLAGAPAAGPAAAAASPPAVSAKNITGVLDKAGQFTTLISLLRNTQVDNQLEIQLNNSQQGVTILAPTDSAFGALRPGALNAITDQQKIAFLQYHALSNFYTLSQFQTVSNPVRTLASGNGGAFTINVTAFGGQVNVSTGLVNTPISNTIFAQKPLAVYEVDKVLLPEELFGAKPPALAPAPDAGAPSPGGGLSPAKAKSAAASASNPSVQIFSATGFMAFVRLSVCIVCASSLLVLL